MRELAEWVKHMSDDTRRLNADLLEEPKSPVVQSVVSKPEQQFVTLWQSLGGPAYVREFRFNRQRRWRFDFAWPESKVAVEIEGGQWIQGRHNRPQGFADDAVKYNAAAASGWRVFRLTPGMITVGSLQMILEVLNDE